MTFRYNMGGKDLIKNEKFVFCEEYYQENKKVRDWKKIFVKDKSDKELLLSLIVLYILDKEIILF